MTDKRLLIQAHSIFIGSQDIRIVAAVPFRGEECKKENCILGDIDKTGYLDRLFVHLGYQRKGIATAICNRLESAVQENIVTHASITARPFFEKRGYKVAREQQVERQGIFLTNFVMIKER